MKYRFIIVFVIILTYLHLFKFNDYFIKIRPFDQKIIKNEHKNYDNLTNNYRCICQRNIEHFPKRIKTAFDTFCLVTRNVGKVLLDVTKDELELINDIDAQLKCIAYNLANCNVYHGDIFEKEYMHKQEWVYLYNRFRSSAESVHS